MITYRSGKPSPVTSPAAIEQAIGAASRPFAATRDVLLVGVVRDLRGDRPIRVLDAAAIEPELDPLIVELRGSGRGERGQGQRDAGNSCVEMHLEPESLFSTGDGIGRPGPRARIRT